MRTSRQVATNLIAVSSLAACLLANSSALRAVPPNRLAWVPSREDAIVIDGVPAAMLPGESALSPGLMSQRPKGLTRPAPARSQAIIASAPAVGEPLPGVVGTPLSPEGLPIAPGDGYYDEHGLFAG